QFPVRRNGVRLLLDHPAVGEVVSPPVRFYVGSHFDEVGRFAGVQSDEYESFEYGDTARRQAIGVLVQIVLHVPPGGEGAMKPVGPGVVRTDELPGVATRIQADAGAAVAADVV